MVVLPRERTLIVEEISAVLLSASNRAVLGGQPGVGKSTVLDALVEHVLEQPGTMVLRSRSLREGPYVPFHGLRDLFADLDVADFTLPEAQRDALLGALGRSHPSETPPHLLYLAIDSVLRELSTRFTVIIAIDDLDVIDHDTHEVIKFVTHRPSNTGRRESYIGTITSDPLLFGSESTFDLAACAVEELYALPPLSRGAFTSVLASSSRFTVGESDVDELFRRTGGNPLWAFELYYQTTAGAPLRNVPKSLSMVTRTKIESRHRWEGDRCPEGLLRLSVGLEAQDVLWADLEQALARA